MDFLFQARRQMLAGQLNDARERLLASFAGLTGEEMLRRGVYGEWSVRDTLVYIGAWDRAATEAYRQMVAGERPPMLDLDEEDLRSFGETHLAAAEDRSLDDVIEELGESRAAMLEFLRGVENQALFAPAPGDEHADLAIAACISVSIGHDEEYAEMIEEWRIQIGEGGPD